MTSAALAVLVAVLAFIFLEGLGRYYPTRPTWRRLRRSRGRRAVVAMRRRFESYGAKKTPRFMKEILLGLVIVWVAGASLLDKRWWEVVLDVVPYVVVYAALLRTPVALVRVGERMKGYEDETGEDLERDDEGGSPELAL